jgi:hypothetical protein
MTEKEFHPAVELLTSSTGGSIHIIRFLDDAYFKTFSNQYLIRNPNRPNSSLEFCHLFSDSGREEVLLVKISKKELHFHGGLANVEHLKALCHSLPFKNTPLKQNLLNHWQKLYRQVMAENSINYLLSIKNRVVNHDLSLLKDTSNYDIEGYQYLRPITIMLIGPPNAGKSTLFNYLVGEQRALISDIEGTTRDSLSASLCFGGHEVNLIDSAGLREEILYQGIQKNDQSIQTQSENLVLHLAQSCDIFCIFNSLKTPDWIPSSKVLHLQSKSETSPEAHPRALPFSVHQNHGCEQLIQTITQRVQSLKSGKISTHFIQPETFI